MLDLNLNPTPRDQRQFATIWLPAFFALIGSIAFWRFRAPTVAVVLWSIGTILTLTAIAIPSLRRPLFIGWMYAAYPIGWVVSHVILIAVYYLVLTPIGLTMRLLGRDPMERRLDRSASTYWVPRVQPRSSSEYFRQY